MAQPRRPTPRRDRRGSGRERQDAIEIGLGIAKQRLRRRPRELADARAEGGSQQGIACARARGDAALLRRFLGAAARRARQRPRMAQPGTRKQRQRLAPDALRPVQRVAQRMLRIGAGDAEARIGRHQARRRPFAPRQAPQGRAQPGIDQGVGTERKGAHEHGTAGRIEGGCGHDQAPAVERRLHGRRRGCAAARQRLRIGQRQRIGHQRSGALHDGLRLRTPGRAGGRARIEAHFVPQAIDVFAGQQPLDAALHEDAFVVGRPQRLDVRRQRHLARQAHTQRLAQPSGRRLHQRGAQRLDRYGMQHRAPRRRLAP